MKYTKLLFIASLIMLSACNDYFNVIPNGSNTEGWMWSSRDNVKYMINNIYTKFEQNYDMVNSSFLASATDDAYHVLPSSSIYSFVNGAWGPTNIPYNIWKPRYEGIRKTNYILTNIDQPVVDGMPLATPFTGDFIQEKERLKGEVYFLKALLYFDIAKHWGGGFIVDEKVYSLDDIDEVIEMEQVDFEELINYIVVQCNSAIELLPDVYSDQTKSLRGRATKVAAQALKSRALLYLASPLYNQANNSSNWVAAAEAAKVVIDNENYGLLEGDDIKDVYQDLFRTPYTKEAIFSAKVVSGSGLEKRNFPPSLQGLSFTQPSESLVRAFPMANGLPITDTNSGYDESQPYENRDPRFYACILYNGSTFKGETIASFTGGKDGPGVSFTSSKTGYYLRKLLSANVDLVENKGDKFNTVLFRYAEQLLNYAEAMNEAFGPETDLDGNGITALSCINQLRERAGAGLVSSGLSQNEFRSIIKNERRIELCFEGHRFYDVRRWKEGEKYFNEPLTGTNITETSEGSYSYSTKTVQERLFSDKMYLFPFPYSEIVKFQGSLVQNPGW